MAKAVIQIVRNYTVTKLNRSSIAVNSDIQRRTKDYFSCFHCGEEFEPNTTVNWIELEEFKNMTDRGRCVCDNCANLIEVEMQNAEVVQ